MSNNPFDATTRMEKIDATIRRAIRGSESKKNKPVPKNKKPKRGKY